MRAPQPPGRYRLAFDLVEELRFWFAEVGSSPLELDVEVPPRIAERRLAVVVHGGATRRPQPRSPRRRSRSSSEDAVAAAHLVAGALPAPDWSRRVLDAHAEGFVAVGGSIETARPGAPRRGRPAAAATRGFAHPLLLPSLLAGLEPGEHEGLPAYVARSDEPSIFDGRIRLRLPRGRPRG